ncbi:MAG: serine/threonine-protein kinase [Myxococcota bacterium]|nr:serine/threonine-protein kinase [Myxococcota bacterium]
MPAEEGQAFGKYFLLRRIAVGGMGEVYLAKLTGPVGFEKLLVIKRILRHHMENEEFVEMFFAEARIAAQLMHSNIVQIFEVGQIEDSYYIAMEYVHGKSLQEIIEQAQKVGEPIPTGHIAEIIAKLCDGLSYAHNAADMGGQSLGLIHRDINPNNLIISYSGQVKIIDFGIAKSGMSMHKTETGTIKGKFVYMSPEQSSAEALDKRSDIFSVGICLYEALTFDNPFAKANIVLSLEAIQRRDPTALDEYSPGYEPFQEIVDKSLAKNIGERYSDCAEMRDALQGLVHRGEIVRPSESLGVYMQRIFEKEITSENRALKEMDENLKSGRWSEAAAAERVAKEQLTQQGQAVPRTDAAPPTKAPQNSALFYLMLALIFGATVVGALVAADLGKKSRAEDLQVAANTATKPEEKVEPTKTLVENTPAKNVTPKKSRGNKKKKSRNRSNRSKPAPTQPNPAVEKVNTVPAKTVAQEQSIKPPAPPPPAKPSFGSLQLSINAPVKIRHNGAPSGQTIAISQEEGVVSFGNGSNASSDPFAVRIRYAVKDGKVTYAVDTKPWAIVRDKNNIGLGRTPLAPRQGGSSSTFEFINPKEKRQLRVTIRYSS